MSTALAAVLTAVAASGCGSSAAAPGPPPATGLALTSARCSRAASRPGAPAAGGRCVYVLTDGRRLRCPEAAFGLSPPAVGALVRASACVPLEELAISPAQRRAFALLATARACLTGRGLGVTGGPVLPRNPRTPDAPDGELIVGARGGAAFVGFYRDPGMARRREAALVANAQRLGGQVERRGAVTVVWIHPPPVDLRADVRACAVG